MKLFIKYMVSKRCEMIVEEELKKQHLHLLRISLGEIEIVENLSIEQKKLFEKRLLFYGLELMVDKKTILIEKIKSNIIELIQSLDEELKVNFSIYLSQKLKYDYTYLSNLFSDELGMTIEHFMIEHKIEKIKELISYGELSITEIAWKLNYSSLAHLSNQFKKITGHSPSDYRKEHINNRFYLEEICGKRN